MRISHRLIVQSVAAGIALIGVGGLGLMGVRHIQQELHIMTKDILPLKHKLLQMEQVKEQSIGNLLALSHASTRDEAQSTLAAVEQNLSELQQTADSIAQDDQIGKIDISAFYQTKNEIKNTIESSFNGFESYQQAAARAQQSLEIVSKSVDDVGKGVQSIENASNLEAKTARTKGYDSIAQQQEAHKIRQLLSNASIILFSIDAVQSKYKLNPTKEKFEALSDEVDGLAAKGIHSEELQRAIEAMQQMGSNFTDEKNGLFALKLGMLNDDSQARKAYRKVRRETASTIDNTTAKVSTLLDNLEFEIILANKDLEAAMAFANDPSSITAVNKNLAIGTRDMRIELQYLFAASDRASLKKEYDLASKKISALTSDSNALSAELDELEMEALSQSAKSITRLLNDVQQAIEAVYKGKLTVFESKAALKSSISSLQQVSLSQREQGQQMVSDINGKLETVLGTVDGQVNKSTSLIVIISLVAVVFSAAFSFVTIRAILSRLQRALHVAEKVSSGDLGPVETSSHKDEVSSVLDALARMVSMLDNSVRQIRSVSTSVNQGAEEISTGNSALSERNGHQAQHLNDTATATRKISELVKGGALAIQQASELSSDAAITAGQGREAVQNAMRSMNNIENGAKEISNIISVIDSIAFQTNILALNAAVEASRAGEVGRGFAVVAGEVRALASKSKEAANQIKEIIDSNVAEVDAGSVLVNDAGILMEDVVHKVDEVKLLIDDISNTSRHQVESISHIDSSVDEIESMTQKNASLSEKTSDAATDLLEQARSLNQAVSVFRL